MFSFTYAEKVIAILGTILVSVLLLVAEKDSAICRAV